MPDQNTRSPSGSRRGVLSEIVDNARLAWRLLNDPRVPALLKLAVPVLALAYAFIPINFIPVFGEVDDLVALMILLRLFIQFAPADIVRWHRADMGQDVGTANTGGNGRANDDVIDAEFRRVN